MARYNTSLASATITGATTISSPIQGAFTALTGSAPYTVTLPAPTLFPGTNQTFYNATGGIITLSTPGGAFNGTGASGTSSNSIFAGNVVSVTSDGTNYIVISEDGSAMTATTGNFSSNLTVSGTLTVQSSGGVSMAPSSAGSIDNVAIGANARSSGAFTTLAANGQVSLTSGTASSSTSTGTLVVTGGLGVSGSVYTGGTVSATNLTATNVTGTLQTASQPNITSTGGLTAPQLILAPSPVNQIAIIRRSAVSGSNGVRIQGNAADGYPNDANAGAYIQLGGGTIGDTYEGNIDIVAFGGNVDGNRNQIRFSNRSGTDTITERMRINKDGNVGIGTTTPGSDMAWGVPTLDVSGSRGALVLRTTNSAGIATLRMTGPDASANDNWHINMGAGVNSTLSFAPKAGGGAIGLVLKNDGTVGIGISAPVAKLHVVASTPTGLGGLPSNSTIVVDSSSSNYLTFRNQADNATNAGLLMQDNNVGGYLLFRNYDSSNAAISDRMFLAGYQGVNIQYGTADNADVAARTTVARFDSNGLTVAANRFAHGAEYETASRSGETSISSGGYKELFRMSSTRLGTSGMFAISATRGNYVTTSQYSWTASHNYQGTITQLSSSSYTQVGVNLDVDSGGGVIISIDWGQGYTASFPMDYTVTVIKMCGGSAIDFSSAGADRSSTPGSYQRRYNFNSQANGFRAENGYFSSLGKGSGSFKIDHPLPELTDTRHLVHSFIEGPKADLIYRGEVDLVAGRAEINIDTESDMTEGTFEALCRTVQCFTSNETDWSAVRGRVTGNILKIECQDTASTATISWMVVGERKDKHMYETEWTDDDGRVIVEPLKNPVQTDFPPYPEHVNTSEDTNGTL